MLRRALATCGPRVCRLAAVQTREKITVPAAGGAVRRRRLKPKLPKDKFTALSTDFLDRVQTAMEPLHPPVNEEFQLERDGNAELVIRTSDKEFVIKVLSPKQQIEFTSPVSGLRTYQWNAMTKRWEDETDSHDIEGLLTRDLMRFCAGIPLF
ncbi:mitochondrial matrix protein frataxin [Phytophthora cinnamomi]|uniref:mitochondrial matrix protein frataxin n=1 Tax=Phytophthora cinnamomi TaxID=4785 RepID=UPI00355AA948|nr:mitochondrial matrix protein frataxin [Phytophthora cinnamomi]